MVNFIKVIDQNTSGMKTFVFGILLCFIISTSHAQVTSAKNALEIGGGITPSGAAFYGSYIRYFRDNSNKVAFGHLPCPGEKSDIRFLPNRMYGKASGYYESGSAKNLDYESTGLDLAFYYSLLKIKQSVFVNAKGGVTGSSDRMKSNTDVGNQVDYSGLNFGVLAGGEIEWFLSPRFTVVAGADHRFHFNNKEPFDNLRWFAYGGLRFNFVKKVDRIF